MKKLNIFKLCLTSTALSLCMGTLANAATVETVAVTQRVAAEGTAKITAQVVVPILNFRSSPFITKNNVLDQLKENETVTILSTEGDWYFVATSTEQLGYVFGDYIKKTETSPAQAFTKNSDVRSQVVAYAKQFLGNPYVYGGTSLTKGVDCSSFTQQMMKQMGYNISRTSASQIHNGVRISLEQLLPGDLVFYGFKGVVSHVAMYIGNGKIIHASSPSTGIIISGMYSQGRKPIIGATRIIE